MQGVLWKIANYGTSIIVSMASVIRRAYTCPHFVDGVFLHSSRSFTSTLDMGPDPVPTPRMQKVLLQDD